MRDKIVQEIANELVETLNKCVHKYDATYKEIWFAIGLLCYSYWKNIEKEGSVGVEGENDEKGV